MLRNTRLKPRSKKRIAKDRLLGKVKRQLWARCNGHCEVPACYRLASDAHHVTKRSKGGRDELQNLTALCRLDHNATDFAVGHGRLVITPRKHLDNYWFNAYRDGHFLGTIGPFTLEA